MPLTLNADKNTIAVGDQVAFSGNLTDQNNNALANKKVYLFSNNIVIDTAIVTDNSGDYSVNLVFNQAGNYNMDSYYYEGNLLSLANPVSGGVYGVQFTDCKITVTADQGGQGSSTLIGRYIDNNNYIGAMYFSASGNFANNDGTIQLFEVSGGVKTILASANTGLNNGQRDIVLTLDGGSATATYAPNNAQSKTVQGNVTIKNGKVALSGDNFFTNLSVDAL